MKRRDAVGVVRAAVGKKPTPKYQSLAVREAPECFDINGTPIRVGRPVRSTPGHTEGSVIQGKVVATLTKNLIEVEHLDGVHKGQVWRSAARLWEAV